MDSSNIEIIFDEHTAVQHVLDNADVGDLIVISNYDINGIQKRISDHREMLDKKATLESAKREMA
jgi:UDP-N-acetylmuramyl tripeptide synthase